MKLSDEQSKKLRFYLMQKRPSITRQEERESARFEGEICYGDRDVRGYRAVTAFIQRGLGDQLEIVGQVLDIARKVQENPIFPGLLFSFGWDDGFLHGKGRARTGGLNRLCHGWDKELCELASTDTGPVQQKIPSLFKPASPTGVPLKAIGEDLFIFFCKDRSVQLTDEAMARYAKPLQHAVWIYCEDNKVEMALGMKEARSPKLPSSRPGAYTTIVGKRNTGETAYQRSLIAAGSHQVLNLGLVRWFDIELPVIFGKAPRRRSLDLLGRDESNRLVLCELKYDKPEKTLAANRKPTTDNPAYALNEILEYYSHAIKNASRLQECNIAHTNRRGDWKWKECEILDNTVLVIAANQAYWDNWQGYNPKSGKGGWQQIKNQIAAIISALPQKPVIKFYTTPNSDFHIQAALQTNQGSGYSPKSLVGDWREVDLS